MATDFRNVPSFSFALYLGLAAFGSYLLSSSPLNSSRPITRENQVDITTGEHKIPARLWQDPLKPIKDKKEEIKQKEYNRQIYQQLLNYSEGSNVLILATMLSGEPYAEEEERRRRRRYAVVSGLAVKGYYPDDSMNIHAMKIIFNGKEKLVPFEWFHNKTAASNSNHKSVLVLWLNM